MDRLRRFFFIIGAEGASFFEWAIWASILILFVGVPVTVAVLQSFLKGILVSAVTASILFFGTLIFVGLADLIISNWAYEISDEEQEFENNYEPRIPLD